MKYVIVDNRIARDGEIIFDEEVKISIGVSNYTVFILNTVPDTIGEELGKPILANNGDMIYGVGAFKEQNCPKRIGKYIASIGGETLPRIGDFRIKSDRHGVTFCFDEMCTDKFPSLENHMEVTLRTGYKLVVFNGSLLGHTLEKTHCMISLDDYSNTGTHCTSNNHDIVQVEFNSATIYRRDSAKNYMSTSDIIQQEISEYYKHKNELDACELRLADMFELVEQANKLDLSICFEEVSKGVPVNG